MTEEMAHRARYAAGVDAPPILLTVALTLDYLAEPRDVAD